jgi:hypothetical protein
MINRKTIGLASLGSMLTVGLMYHEYSKPPIAFTRDAQGNVSIPANTKPEELFVNPAAGDFRLRAENPAIGAGAPLPEVPTDFDGKIRDSIHPSIGAFEFTGTPNTSGGSASKFFSAPFTYFVLFVTLLANVVSLYLSRKMMKESAHNQIAILRTFHRTRNRKEKKELPPDLLEKILKEEQRKID